MKNSKSKRLSIREFEMENPSTEYDGLDTGQTRTHGNQQRTYIVSRKFKNSSPSAERKPDPYPQEITEEGYRKDWKAVLAVLTQHLLYGNRQAYPRYHLTLTISQRIKFLRSNPDICTSSCKTFQRLIDLNIKRTVGFDEFSKLTLRANGA